MSVFTIAGPSISFLYGRVVSLAAGLCYKWNPPQENSDAEIKSRCDVCRDGDDAARLIVKPRSVNLKSEIATLKIKTKE